MNLKQMLLILVGAGTLYSFNGNALANGLAQEDTIYTIKVLGKGKSRATYYNANVNPDNSKLIKRLEQFDGEDRIDDNCMDIDSYELAELKKMGLRLVPCQTQLSKKAGKKKKKKIKLEKKVGDVGSKFKKGNDWYSIFSGDNKATDIDLYNRIEDLYKKVQGLQRTQKLDKKTYFETLAGIGKEVDALKSEYEKLKKGQERDDKVRPEFTKRLTELIDAYKNMEGRLRALEQPEKITKKAEKERGFSKWLKELGRQFKELPKQESYENFVRMGAGYAPELYEDGSGFREGPFALVEGNYTHDAGKYFAVGLNLNEFKYGESTFDNESGKEYVTSADASILAGYKSKLFKLLAGLNIGKTNANGNYSGFEYELTTDKIAGEARAIYESKPVSAEITGFYGSEDQNQLAEDSLTGDGKFITYGGDAGLTFHLPRGVNASAGYQVKQREGEFTFAPGYTEPVSDTRQKMGARLEVPICKGINLYGEGAYTNSKSNWDKLEGVEGIAGLGVRW
ncbi:S46 family peptidase [archaeon]|nr:S46 family peptidase [archaeon]